MLPPERTQCPNEVESCVPERPIERSQFPVQGLYRLAVNGTTSYARVRTLQADIALPNHFSLYTMMSYPYIRPSPSIVFAELNAVQRYS